MTTKWPRIVIHKGPMIAGVEKHDAIALTPDHLLYITTYLESTRQALVVFALKDGKPGGFARRFSSENERFEIDEGRVPRKWTAQRTRYMDVGSAEKYGTEWELRFVDDGPAITTTRRLP